ncbi:MAG: VTT domain-containing protein [Candidatus Yonathbacteria bacterium]|nr:VTT domain-containing protein [Candidatus Yonathbacteria bacterium]
MQNLTIEHIVPFLLLHQNIGYILLFFMMVLEGEIFLIIAATLVHLKAFDIGVVFLVSLSGVIVGNIAWYHLGSFIGTRGFAKRMVSRAEKTILYFLPHFRERPFNSIFISKFIYGVNHAVVIVAGVLKIKFSLFLEAETLASIAWVILQMSVGYFFGYAAINITHNVSRFVLIIGVFVIAFILLHKFSIEFYERRKHQVTQKDNHA